MSETPAWNSLSRTSLTVSTTNSNTPSGLSPAWNPSSRTPPTHSPGLDTSSDPLASPEISKFSTHEHVLLNVDFLNLKLCVIVNGGQHSNEELTTLICEVEGKISMRYVKYGTSHFLQPNWVTPRHPNPTHDNGLLVVIKGQHLGKYVRRLNHRNHGHGKTIILAVFTRFENMVDMDTGERLELPPDYLCKVDEPKEDKDRNKKPMMDLRRAYNKKAQ